MASNLIDNPDDIAHIRAFSTGLENQGTVIQELLNKKTAKMEEPGEYITGRDKLNELLATQPRDVRTRLLQVYDKLFKAKQILNGYQDVLPQRNLTEDMEQEQVESAEASTSASPALTATLNVLLKNEFSEALTWFFAG